MEENKIEVIIILIIKKTVLLSFFLFGIGGLITPNAIFTDMDFFIENVKFI